MTLETYIEHLTEKLKERYGYAGRNRYEFRTEFFFGESEIKPMKRIVDNKTLTDCMGKGKVPETLTRVLK